MWLLLLAACGPAEADAVGDQPWPFVFRRTGGIAGVEQTLTVTAAGLAHWESNGETVEFLLPENIQTALQSELEAARFRQLPETTPELPRGADLFSYTITFDDHTVSFHDGTVPADLEPVLRLIDRIVANRSER